MKKVNILIIICLLILVSTLIFVGCLKNNDISVTESKSSLNVITNTNENYVAEFKIDDNTLRYQSETQSGKTKSTLNVFKDNSIIYQSLYDYDTTIADYRLLQHKKVEELAKSIKLDLQEIDYVLISSQAKAFLDAIFKNSGVRKRHVQSLFFHLAIMNTKRRAVLRTDNVYQCVPLPEYVLGKSYFWCQEDFLIKVDLIKKVFKRHPDLIQDFKAKNLFNYIDTTNKDYLSYDKIYSFSVPKEKYLQALDIIYSKNNQKNIAAKELVADCAWWCPLGCGSDHGCCGNYSGCCLLWSVNCLIHDEICSSCEPAWFCLPGCVPD